VRILIACEKSGLVRDAFTAKGHDALSCDLEDTEHPGKHFKGDVREVLNEQWDMLIAFPPCTYLALSGLHWLHREEGRREKQREALDFAALFFNHPAKKKVIENPVGALSTHFGKPSQIIQPYRFGEDASKKTCLWLWGLPLLRKTKYVPARHVNGKKVWGNQTSGGWNILGSGVANRAEIRSRTYPGIANAMADQWG